MNRENSRVYGLLAFPDRLRQLRLLFAVDADFRECEWRSREASRHNKTGFFKKNCSVRTSLSFRINERSTAVGLVDVTQIRNREDGS